MLLVFRSGSNANGINGINGIMRAASKKHSGLRRGRSRPSRPVVAFGIVSLVFFQAATGFVRAQTPPTASRSQSQYSLQEGGDKIGPGVREALESDGSVRVIVALQSPASLRRPTRAKFNEIKRDIEASQNAVIGNLTAAEHSLRRRYGLIPAFAADVRSEKALDRLARHPLVVRVDVDERVTTQLAQSVRKIRADSMHTHGYTGEGVVVATLDTGIDTDHPDLVDDLIHEECFLGGPYCPNGLDHQSGPGAAEDDDGHGTHIAGIITSAGIVSSVGVAPDAKIIAIKILASTGWGWTSDVFAGLDWILDNSDDIDIVNMSFSSGGPYSGECDNVNAGTMAYAAAINTLRALGVTTFAASGNNFSSSQMISPACVSGAISVGATDDSDEVAFFSNTDAYTDLLAPGVGIVSDLPGGTTGSDQGTSMASPHAAGCAALQIQAGRATTPGSIEAWLKGSGTTVTDSRNGLNFPRIDCFAEPIITSSEDLVAVAGPPDGTGCGGTGTYTLHVTNGTISRTGDSAFNNLAVGYNCWSFDEPYVRVYIMADDPATFDHWESPSSHLYLIDEHNGTSAGTIETSFNLLGESPTFEAVHNGGTPTPDLLLVNRVSGAGSIVGPLSGGSSSVYPAIAVHPTTQLIYVGGGNGQPVLHAVDPATGALTPIGAAGPRVSRIAAIDFRSDGTLYASVKETGTGGQGANWLATIDPTTGEATLVGSFGVCGAHCAIEGMEAIAFDPGGVLYGALSERAPQGTPGLYTIDRFTGSATFVAPILDDSGIPPSGGITSLQFVDGILYGGTAVSKTPPGDGGWLVTINEITGEFTKIGASSATGGRGLIGLAPRLIRPPNDNLADAAVVGSLPYFDEVINAHATSEPSEAYGSCSSDDGQSIWWSFSPATTGRFEVNTNGSNINTGLSIWSGSAHPLDEIACDDDQGDGTAALIRFDAAGGETYLLRVIGYAGTEGNVVLNVSPIEYGCTVQTDIPTGECLALDDLFENTDGGNWVNSEDWKLTNSPCTWYGITCTDGHVTSLTLGDNDLTGPLPESIGDLSHLASLDLSDNSLNWPDSRLNREPVQPDFVESRGQQPVPPYSQLDREPGKSHESCSWRQQLWRADPRSGRKPLQSYVPQHFRGWLDGHHPAILRQPLKPDVSRPQLQPPNWADPRIHR